MDLDKTYACFTTKSIMHVPLFSGKFPASTELKSLMHTYRFSPVLVLGIVTGSTKVLGNWPEGRKNEKISTPISQTEDYM